MTDKKQDNQEEKYNIDNLVFSYQSGDEEAGEELLRIYGGHPSMKEMSLYLGKYYKMLRFGKFKYKDKDSRLFIQLFIKDAPTREALKKSYQYTQVKKDSTRKLGDISESLKYMDDEDLAQDLRMLFLKQCMRYKKMNRTFGAYLYNSYRYAVKNYIKAVQKPYEPYIHMPKELLRLAEDRMEDSASNIKPQDIVLAKTPMMVMDEKLGNSWVRGINCGEEFKSLTPLQRLIIKLNYHEGWSDGKIADMMGIHINTIFRQRKKADNLVKDAVKSLTQEGYYK